MALVKAAAAVLISARSVSRHKRLPALRRQTLAGIHCSGVSQPRCPERLRETSKSAVVAAPLPSSTKKPDMAQDSPIGSPWHEIWDVDGRATEVFGILNPSGQSALQVLILPGNPGSAGYYKAYIAALHAALQSQADVYAVSHLGHASSKQARQYDKVFSLQDQIQHKVSFVQQHLCKEGKAPLAIIGHSIGAYMALKASKQLEAIAKPGLSVPVAKVVALFPFFQADLSSSQQHMMQRLTCMPRVMGACGALLGMLPLAAQKWLVNWWGGGLADYAQEATVGLLNYHTIRNGFHLGHTEFRDLAGPVDWKQLQELGDKVAVVCNPSDVWFSKRSWEQMWLEVPEIQAYMEDSQRHDFCVSKALSIALAQRTANILQDLLS